MSVYRNLAGETVSDGDTFAPPDGLRAGDVSDKVARTQAVRSAACLTPGCMFTFDISPDAVSVYVTFPTSIDMSEAEAIALEERLHDGVEAALSHLFFVEAATDGLRAGEFTATHTGPLTADEMAVDRALTIAFHAPAEQRTAAFLDALASNCLAVVVEHNDHNHNAEGVYANCPACGTLLRPEATDGR